MSTIHIRIEIVSNKVAYQQYGGTNVGPVTTAERMRTPHFHARRFRQRAHPAEPPAWDM